MPEKTKRKYSLHAIALFVAITMFLVALFGLLYPYTRRANDVKNVGTTSIAQLDALSLALSHYSADAVTATSITSGETPDYKNLSALLYKVKTYYDFEKIYILFSPTPGKYHYVADSNYRDTAVMGVEYMTPAQEYSLVVYQAAKTPLQNVFAKAQANAYTKELVTTQNKIPVVTSFLPIVAADGTVVAVLAADKSPAATTYNMLGFIDLHLVVLGALIIMAMAIALLVSMKKWQGYRAGKGKKENPAITPPPPADQLEESLNSTENQNIETVTLNDDIDAPEK